MSKPQVIVLPNTDLEVIYYEILCDAFVIKGPTIESVIMKWVSLRTCVNSYSEIEIKLIATVSENSYCCLPGGM